ncbi:hypothetical protein E2C01_015112 [Portunus trituberculatus]|uniref:Uncharacterized protein n=1 Tax=Portunus trituberculatus TaxID=210409 RepID=A0A5B7DMA0_PORTR|nr:hypothetical protein [Portunus trituberculatus]
MLLRVRNERQTSPPSSPFSRKLLLPGRWRVVMVHPHAQSILASAAPGREATVALLCRPQRYLTSTLTTCGSQKNGGRGWEVREDLVRNHGAGVHYVVAQSKIIEAENKLSSFSVKPGRASPPQHAPLAKHQTHELGPKYTANTAIKTSTRSIYHGTARVTSQKYASDRRRTSFVSLMTIVTCQTSEGVAAYKGSSIGLIDGQVSDRIHTSIRLHPLPDAKLLNAGTRYHFEGIQGQHDVTDMMVGWPVPRAFLHPSRIIKVITLKSDIASTTKYQDDSLRPCPRCSCLEPQHHQPTTHYSPRPLPSNFGPPLLM